MEKYFLLPGMFLLLVLGTTFVNAQTISPSCLVIPSTLSLGSKDTASNNNSITALQDFLRANGFFDIASSGYYGPFTAAAVKDFQTFYGLPALGIVGPLTRVAIQAASCQPAAQSVPAPAPTPVVPPATTTASTTTTTIASTTAATSTSATTTVPSLPYHAQTFSDWQTAWGDSSTTETGALRLQGSLSNNGAEALYPASKDWTNYRYQADLSVANGNISLIGRYVDANNFVVCSFAKNWVELDQVYNGSSTVLISKSVDGILPGQQGLTQTTSVAMDVNGNQVGCAGYGPTDNITYTLPAGSPMQGGIGMESWYDTPLADQLDLISVRVDPL